MKAGHGPERPCVPRQRHGTLPTSSRKGRHPAGRQNATQGVTVYDEEAIAHIRRAWSTEQDTADEIWAEAVTARERLVGWLRVAVLSLAFVGYLAYLLIGGRP